MSKTTDLVAKVKELEARVAQDAKDFESRVEQDMQRFHDRVIALETGIAGKVAHLFGQHLEAAKTEALKPPPGFPPVPGTEGAPDNTPPVPADPPTPAQNDNAAGQGGAA